MPVYISGAGMTKFGRMEESLLSLMREASRRAIEDAGAGKVDAVLVGSMNPDEFSGDSHTATAFADCQGLTGTPAIRVETGMSTGAAAFHTGFHFVASGVYETVLVACGEKMTHLSTAAVTRILSKVIAPDERKLGATMPALAALITRRYMHDYGLDRETLSLVAVKNHANGALNPYAQFQKTIKTGDVATSRLVADPLTVYDCAPISDGACAVILSRTKGGVECSGIGHATDTWALQDRNSLTSFGATMLAARQAYGMAGVGPADIDVAELHDAFSAFEIIDSEDVGFFGPGAGWKALKDGKTGLNGELPVNPGGGLKARGHPIGASGLSQIIELYWQLSNQAGKRQVDGARTALAQSIGGLASNNFVSILRRRGGT
jgi:acetyl-CoA acetyltransferase